MPRSREALEEVEKLEGRKVAKEGWEWTKGEEGGLRQSGYAAVGRRACALEGYSRTSVYAEVIVGLVHRCCGSDLRNSMEWDN